MQYSRRGVRINTVMVTEVFREVLSILSLFTQFLIKDNLIAGGPPHLKSVSVTCNTLLLWNWILQCRT